MKRIDFGKIVWFTGLSGAGKTTLSKKVKNDLTQLNFKVKMIDGDDFRKKTKVKNKFTKKNITENNMSIIRYIDKIKYKYDYIIVAVISPLLITRSKAREKFKKNYVEVLVKCNLRTLIKRDTKGLYKLAIEKKIKNLIGFNSKIVYEKSHYSKIIINSEILDIKNSVKKIFKKIV
ncbi:adenylyl-sulfate kinase [Candidatus Pelagibacter sp.]|nr:adenylyl-sulfate kinase [Candidatus Pelagibacter sp.]|tara:strand:+ start:1024 stop:1551 length:528 start_codon:yes stop_codon:yes gene_type:complete